MSSNIQQFTKRAPWLPAPFSIPTPHDGAVRLGPKFWRNNPFIQNAQRIIRGYEFSNIYEQVIAGQIRQCNYVQEIQETKPTVGPVRDCRTGLII